MADAGTIPADKLCEITGLTDRRHRQLAKQGYFPPPVKAQYQLATTLKGLFRYYRETKEDNRKLEETVIREKLRQQRADSDMAEMERDKMRGDSIASYDVKRAWEAVVVATKQKILAIPSKAESRHVDGMTAKQLRAMLDVEVREALEEMSVAPDYKQDDETETDVAEDASGDAGTVPAPADPDGQPVG